MEPAASGLLGTKRNSDVAFSGALCDERARNKPRSEMNQEIFMKELELAKNFLHSKDASGFDSFVQRMKANGYRLELTAIIDKVFTLNILKNAAGDRTAYTMLLQSLTKYYPDIERYFSRVKGVEGKGAGFEVFSDSGINMIIDHLKEKGTLRDVDVARHAGFTYPEDAFQLDGDVPSQHIAKSIKNMLADPHAPQKCALVLTGVGGTKHVIPIFIQRTKEGVFRCLISDSVSRRDWSEHALREVRLAFISAGIPPAQYEVYVYAGLVRQINGADCALFFFAIWQ